MNNEYPKMVYRAPGPHDIHGHRLDFATTDSPEDHAAALKAGWHETTPAAVEAYEKQKAAEAEARAAAANAAAMKAAEAQRRADNAPPTRAELEAKATELGISFKANTTDAALNKAIEDKLAKG